MIDVAVAPVAATWYRKLKSQIPTIHGQIIDFATRARYIASQPVSP